MIATLIGGLLQWLKRRMIWTSRGGGHWSPDDFDVRLGDAGGKVIGRIFRAPQSPQDRPWFWTITERVPQWPTQRGYAATREDAMADFEAAWERKP
jgi:hypothetical protein